ncbi:Neuroendocrine convertase 1 [Perkinsus chesapeaki]|uniref:Neuroendocrine convertase 1 n=1 Tax=Perkinsus chesapeaki TaxID=330153 RepID=A0A7J6MRD9_PERCH|nr:Neuroendocrine convertase 1 [Perkinsus chesapeaki]
MLLLFATLAAVSGGDLPPILILDKGPTPKQAVEILNDTVTFSSCSSIKVSPPLRSSVSGELSLQILNLLELAFLRPSDMDAFVGEDTVSFGCGDESGEVEEKAAATVLLLNADEDLLAPGYGYTGATLDRTQAELEIHVNGTESLTLGIDLNDRSFDAGDDGVTLQVKSGDSSFGDGCLALTDTVLKAEVTSSRIACSEFKVIDTLQGGCTRGCLLAPASHSGLCLTHVTDHNLETQLVLRGCNASSIWVGSSTYTGLCTESIMTTGGFGSTVCIEEAGMTILHATMKGFHQGGDSIQTNASDVSCIGTELDVTNTFSQSCDRRARCSVPLNESLARNVIPNGCPVVVDVAIECPSTPAKLVSDIELEVYTTMIQLSCPTLPYFSVPSTREQLVTLTVAVTAAINSRHSRDEIIITAQSELKAGSVYNLKLREASIRPRDMVSGPPWCPDQVAASLQTGPSDEGYRGQTWRVYNITLLEPHNTPATGQGPLSALLSGEPAISAIAVSGPGFAIGELARHLSYVADWRGGTDEVLVRLSASGRIVDEYYMKIHVKEKMPAVRLTARLGGGEIEPLRLGHQARALQISVDYGDDEAGILCAVVAVSSGLLGVDADFIMQPNGSYILFSGDLFGGSPSLRIAGSSSDMKELLSEGLLYWLPLYPKMDVTKFQSHKQLGITKLMAYVSTYNIMSDGMLPVASSPCEKVRFVCGTVFSAVNGSRLSNVEVTISITIGEGASVSEENLKTDVFGEWCAVPPAASALAIDLYHPEFLPKTFVHDLMRDGEDITADSGQLDAHLYSRQTQMQFTKQFTLKWDGDDIDIHALDPYGCHVYYNRPVCAQGHSLTVTLSRDAHDVGRIETLTVHGKPLCETQPLNSCSIFIWVDMQGTVMPDSLQNATLEIAGNPPILLVINSTGESSTAKDVWLAGILELDRQLAFTITNTLGDYTELYQWLGDNTVTEGSYLMAFNRSASGRSRVRRLLEKGSIGADGSARVPRPFSIVGLGESCSDGNLVDGDGCSHDGLVEPGYLCYLLYDPTVYPTQRHTCRDFGPDPIVVLEGYSSQEDRDLNGELRNNFVRPLTYMQRGAVHPVPNRAPVLSLAKRATKMAKATPGWIRRRRWVEAPYLLGTVPRSATPARSSSSSEGSDYEWISFGAHEFRFYDDVYSGAYVSANGFVTFSSPDLSGEEVSLERHYEHKRISVFWTDIDSTRNRPDARITFQLLDENTALKRPRAVVTWVNVTYFGNEAAIAPPSTFQLTILRDSLMLPFPQICIVPSVGRDLDGSGDIQTAWMNSTQSVPKGSRAIIGVSRAWRADDGGKGWRPRHRSLRLSPAMYIKADLVPPVNESFLMEMWLKLDPDHSSTGSGTVFSTKDVALVLDANLTLLLHYGGQSVRLTDLALRTGTWYHLRLLEHGPASSNVWCNHRDLARIDVIIKSEFGLRQTEGLCLSKVENNTAVSENTTLIATSLSGSVSAFRLWSPVPDESDRTGGDCLYEEIYDPLGSLKLAIDFDGGAVDTFNGTRVTVNGAVVQTYTTDVPMDCSIPLYASGLDQLLPCNESANCPNSMLDSFFETCDTGAIPGSGCTSQCEPEPGWTCNKGNSSSPSVCSRILCGDGKLAEGIEECEDGNTANGDGCSSSCEIETGWQCGYLNTSDPTRSGPLLTSASRWIPPRPVTMATQWAVMAARARVQLSKDGHAEIASLTILLYVALSAAMAFVAEMRNAMTATGAVEPSLCIRIIRFNGDGCSSNCMRLLCRIRLRLGNTGPCRGVRCGDGVIDRPAEECDDGNVYDGDGCSSTCTKEDEVTQAPPSMVMISIPVFPPGRGHIANIAAQSMSQ